MIAFGNCGGIVATFTFSALDAPEYVVQNGLCAVVGLLDFGGCGAAGLCGNRVEREQGGETK